jgi:hypothetical protein
VVKLSLHEQIPTLTEENNRARLQLMKHQAIKENDVAVFNSITSYEKSGNDVTVLIAIIKRLYDENMRLRD